MRYFTWRSWLLRARRLWRSSLQMRTVTISVVMSTIAVGIIGAYMSISVGANLFDTRLQDALAASERSNVVAQTRFDATQQTAGLDLDVAMKSASTAVQQASSTPAGTDIAILRTPGQAVSRDWARAARAARGPRLNAAATEVWLRIVSEIYGVCSSSSGCHTGVGVCSLVR